MLSRRIYGPLWLPVSLLFLNGAGTKDRTRDLRITSALLYQLSYTGERGQKFKRHYFRILLHRKYFISV